MKVAKVAQLALVTMLLGSFAYAQEAPAGPPRQGPPGGRAAGGAGGEGGGGVGTLIDRSEVRVLRNELGPGVVRNTHSHDNVAFHLIMAITPGIEVTVNSEKPVLLEPGQVVFLLKSTKHSFRNTSTTTPAVCFELFVNEGPAAAAIRKDGPGAAMALLAANGIK